MSRPPATATLYARPAGSAGPGWVAFVAFATEQPQELTLAQAWSSYLGNPRGGSNGGCFVVAAAAPPALPAWLDGFSAEIARRNGQFGGFAYRYLFVGDPTTPAALAGAVAFSTTSADPAQPALVAGLGGGNTPITGATFGLVVANQAYLRVDLDNAGLRFGPNGNAGVVLLANKYQPLTLPLDGGGDVRLPLDGAAAGDFRFGLELHADRDPQKDAFAQLDVGIKWFTGIGSGADRRIVSLRYPLFGVPVDGSAIPFDVAFDPLRPLDHARTAFTFRGLPARDGPVCPPMESALRDGLLHPVRIQPLAGRAQLVLQRDRVTVASGGPHQRDLVYLVPSGPFALLPGVSRPPATRVMCGTSPLETIVFDPPGSLLTFHPDQPAYSPLLESPPPPAGAPRLTADYLTAWATVTTAGTPAGPAPTYFAQPQGAALYAHGDAADVPYLVHAETPAADLRDARASASYPLAPYAQLAFAGHPDTLDADQVAQLERDALSVERRARIAGTGNRPSGGGDGPRRATTPQGFILDLGPDGSWRRIHLGQTSWSPDPATTPPTVTTLAFADPDDTVRGAFQTNQQFLVVTQPRTPWRLVGSTSPPPLPGAKTTFEDALAPQGWPFDIRVGTGSNPGDYRNVLLFKFCDGALEDRVDDVARWTAAADFNADPTDVAAWLRSYIEQAKVLAAGPDGDYFRRFVDAVTSPSWRGLLALRADADATLLPQELRGLAAGIDPDAFNAHHVGIDLSFVDTSGSDLTADGNSSVFATVYYVDPDYAAALASGASPDLPVPVAGTADWAFRVLSLKTLFVNAQVAAFASKAQVTLNRLFGEQVAGLTLNGAPAPSSSLVLDGTYENHDGVGVYVFATGADARFRPVSNLWRSLEIVRATFSTLRAPASGTVLSRFSFQGFLDFATTTVDDGSGRQVPFDLLSFGGDGGGEVSGSGLPFSELHLDMSFDTAAPGSPSFSFLIDQMTFAPAVTQARASSLFARMPLTLTGIVAGRTAPGDLGYLPVSPLGLPGAPLGDAWYGLVYTLDLGSAGALAARAGFTAQLLVAWGPASQGNSFRVALGLALPGASSTSRGFSLQGVLKLTIDRLLLYRDPVSGTFVLRLTNVLLSLLGVKLPPGTSTAFIVFGNPDPSQRDTVGWYAAVNRERRRDDRRRALLTTGGGG